MLLGRQQKPGQSMLGQHCTNLDVRFDFDRPRLPILRRVGDFVPLLWRSAPGVNKAGQGRDPLDGYAFEILGTTCGGYPRDGVTVLDIVEPSEHGWPCSAFFCRNLAPETGKRFVTFPLQC